MPTTLVGMTVNSKPNFLAVAHVGILNHDTPQFFSIGLNKAHFSNSGIRENGTFSICLPSEDLLIETDYCGMVSGRHTDKAALFDVFYGELQTAPMIRQCPVCMECRLDRILDFPRHEIFVGELVQTYAHETVIRNGKIDITMVKPLLFDMNTKKYYALGGSRGDCWNAGKRLKTT